MKNRFKGIRKFTIAFIVFGIILVLIMFFIKSITGLTLLHFAVNSGNEITCKIIVRLGADVNSDDNSVKWTPLHSALYKKHNKIAKFLVEKGADVNAVELDNYWTPLHIAIINDDLEMVKYLVENGAEVNPSRLVKEQPLSLSRRLERDQITLYLIGQGAKEDMEIK